MNPSRKTKAELVREVENLRARVTDLETCEVERKQAEEALRESEEKYRQLFENESDAVVIFDEETKAFEDANQAALRFFGYSEDEFLTLTVQDISAEKEKTEIAVERIIKGEPDAEYIPLRMFRRKDGMVVPGEISAGTFVSGGRKKIIGAVRDITRRIRAEQAVRESEELYRLLFGNLNDVVFSFDCDFRITSISPSVEKVLGYRPEELIGKRIDELNILSEESLKEAFSESERIMAGEKLTPSVLEFIAKDGTKRFGEVSGAPLFKEGKVIGLTDVARDITQRVQMEEALEKYREHLEELVEERTAKLSKANEELREHIAERKRAEEALRKSEARYRRLSENLEETVKQKVAELQQSERLASIGRMVSTVAHDVRNPLQNIQIGVDSLQKEIGENRDLSEILEGINYGVNLLNGVISELLEYSSPVQLQRTPMPVGDIVRGALRTLAHRLHGITIHLDLEQEEKEISVDPVKFTAVMANLISNSAEAMPNGGKIEIRSHFSVEDGREALNLSVSDSGSGISEEELEQIREPFYTTKTTGTGLGIPICKKLIEAHNGKLDIWSRINEGTTVKIMLLLAGGTG